MSGIVGNGFMGKKKGLGPWRYLHDEVTGGRLSFSHLLTVESYDGNSYRAAGVDYGFINNVAALHEAEVSETLTWPNQLAEEKTISGAGAINRGYDPAQNDFNSALNLLQPTSVKYAGMERSTTPHTVIWVVKGYTNFRNFFGFFGSQAPGRDAYFMEPINTEDARIWCRSGSNNGTKQFRMLGGWLWPQDTTKIIVLTYDGTREIAGWNIYRNDMSISLEKTIVTNGALLDVEWGTGITGFFSFGNAQGNGNETLFQEVHYFDKVLSLSERNTVKEILEQYYTFT